MLCDECGKNSATVHITKVINGAQSEMHLCQECAHNQGQFGLINEPPFSFHNILAGLFETDSGRSDAKVVRQNNRCPSCGLTFADFRRLGHLGCDDCYDTFESELRPLLRKIHGSTTHTGKVPQGKQYRAMRKNRELTRLRKELHEAVVNEEYERAAQLRDTIRGLESEAE